MIISEIEYVKFPDTGGVFIKGGEYIQSDFDEDGWILDKNETRRHISETVPSDREEYDAQPF